MRMLVSLTPLVLFGTAALGQPPVPKGQVPQLGVASAVEKDGKVIIEVYELREVIRMKVPKGGDVFVEKRHWSPLTTCALGTYSRIYRLDGKIAGRQEVFNALAKPRG